MTVTRSYPDLSEWTDRRLRIALAGIITPGYRKHIWAEINRRRQVAQ